MKFYTLSSNIMDELLVDDKDDTGNGEEEGSYHSSEEDGVHEELDTRGNPKESTSQSPTLSPSHHDKDLPAGSGVGQLGSRSRSKRGKKKKEKGDRSEIKVIRLKLDDLIKLSESDEGGGDDDSSIKGSKGLFSSLLEQFLVSINSYKICYVVNQVGWWQARWLLPEGASPYNIPPPKIMMIRYYKVINARRMREGYCSQFVCLSVCLFVCVFVADPVQAYDACATN